MLFVNADMSALYTQGEMSRQPFRPLEVPLPTVPHSREQVYKGAHLTLVDNNLSLGAVAQVLEVKDAEHKAVVLVPMEKVYSLHAPVQHSPNRAPVPPSASASVNPKKKFVTLGITAILLCLAFAALLYYWREFIPTFLILNSPFDGLLISMAADSNQASALIIGAWVGVLAPFVAAIASWSHWKEGGDGVSGGVATLLSSIAAGLSTLLLVAAFKVKTMTAGFFRADSFDDALSRLIPDESSMFYTQEGTLLLWFVFAFIWFLIILTGMSANRSEKA